MMIALMMMIDCIDIHYICHYLSLFDWDGAVGILVGAHGT